MQYQKYIEQIVFSKSFRRLTNKTQLFPTIDGDHFRTRMSHTLEVVAISKKNDKSNIGENSQKLHNMFLKHIAYSIADMTDDFAIKTYNELYGIKN